MKYVVSIIAVAAAIAAFSIFGSADSFALGKMTLSGKTIEYANQTVTVAGKASFTSISPQGTVKPGTMRLDAMRADSIRVDLVKDKGGKLSPDKAVATGDVFVKAKRADIVAGQGSVLRDVHATAKSATFDSGLATVVLTGSAEIKILEAGAKEPIAVLSGDKVTISLKDNKMRVEGQSEKPAEITYTQSDKEK